MYASFHTYGTSKVDPDMILYPSCMAPPKTIFHFMEISMSDGHGHGHGGCWPPPNESVRAVLRNSWVTCLLIFSCSYIGSVGHHSNLPTEAYEAPYVEVQEVLVRSLTMGIIRVTIWVIWLINLLTKSP